MKIIRVYLVCFFILVCFFSRAQGADLRTRIFIVDSYHPEYLWSQETAEGVGQALLDFEFLENSRQVQELKERNTVEGSRAVIKKGWMDTKRQNSKLEIGDSTARIVNEIRSFNPDIILLGDDNAANYIGNLYMDREIPVVFWGINGLPLKYGLIDSIARPGHNVTGIYQSGYIIDCLDYLTEWIPAVKNIAVLSDDSETSRAKVKGLQYRLSKGGHPFKIIEVAVTNSFSKWKTRAEQFANKADAFVVFNHNSLKNDDGRPVDPMTVGSWYLTTIQKPECSDERQFAVEGMLLVVDDSGFKQGYEAVRLVHEIIVNHKPPGGLKVIAPARGAVIANRQRASQLGLSLEHVNFVEEIIEESFAFKDKP